MDRVTLASLERAYTDYGCDNALDALRIASTDRTYRVPIKRRRRRAIH